MTAAECLAAAIAAGETFQRPINEFIDEYRRAALEGRAELVRAPIHQCGELQGLVAGVVSALCRETGTPAPEWVAQIGSPQPFFAFPARSFELRLLLMLESPPPFRVRNVFVPREYLSRA